MADLATLMHMAPSTGAMFTGMQFDSDMQDADMKRQELAQLIAQRAAEEQRKQALAPYDLEKARLANETTRAQLPGVQADSRAKGLAADFTQATQPGKIALTNQDNSLHMYNVAGQTFSAFAYLVFVPEQTASVFAHLVSVPEQTASAFLVFVPEQTVLLLMCPRFCRYSD